MDTPPRGIRSFVDIRKREFEPALLFFFFWFLVIVVFQALRPLKKGLFVEHLGADVELDAKLANIPVAILAVVVFTALYNRFGSRWLIPTLCAGFMVALLAFSGALGGGGAPGPSLNWSFYLFGDAWSTVWVTTFWAYLTELTRTEQSKRLYGLIGAGGVIGGLIANFTVWQYIEDRRDRCPARWRRRRDSRDRPHRASPRDGCRPVRAPIGRRDTGAPAIGEGKGAPPPQNAAFEGARLVTASRYLLAIAMIMFLYEINSQILDYQYSTAAEAVEGAAGTQAFFSRIGTIVGSRQRHHSAVPRVLHYPAVRHHDSAPGASSGDGGGERDLLHHADADDCRAADHLG